MCNNYNYALYNIAYINDPELNSVARRYEWIAWKYHPFHVMDMGVINSDIHGHSSSQSGRDSENRLLHVKGIILFLFRFACCKDIENR